MSFFARENLRSLHACDVGEADAINRVPTFSRDKSRLMQHAQRFAALHLLSNKTLFNRFFFLIKKKQFIACKVVIRFIASAIPPARHRWLNLSTIITVSAEASENSKQRSLLHSPI